MRGRDLHTVCEEARCPNIHAVLGGARGVVPDRRRRLHAALRFLRHRHRQAGGPTTPTSRERVARDRGRHGAALRGRHRGRPRRPPRRRRVALRRDLPRDQAAAARLRGGAADPRLQRVRGRACARCCRRSPTCWRTTSRRSAGSSATCGRRSATSARWRSCARSKRLAPHIATKSNLILGMGETEDEVGDAMRDLRAVDCDILTIGQYLQPDHRHLALQRFAEPAEFARLRALRRGARASPTSRPARWCARPTAQGARRPALASDPMLRGSAERDARPH